jgi:hypothetical protein
MTKSNVSILLSIILLIVVLIQSTRISALEQQIYHVSDNFKTGLVIEGQSTDVDKDGLLALYSLDQSRSFYSEFQMRSSGWNELEMDNSSCKKAGCQALSLISRIDDDDQLNTMLYLDTYTNGVPQSGLGSALALRTQAQDGSMETLATITATRDSCGNPVLVFIVGGVPSVAITSEGIVPYGQADC